MEREVLAFSDFINEEINYTSYDNGVCRLEDRWFFYNPEDDIIYGCNERPVGEDKLFSFNPTTCKFIMGGEEKQYDVNNPVCLVIYDLDEEKVEVYTDDALNKLQTDGFKGTEILSQRSRNQIMDMFERDDDKKHLLLYGDQLIASTFDVIEENLK